MKLLEDGGAFPRRRNYLSTAKPLRWNVLGTLLYTPRPTRLYTGVYSEKRNERKRREDRENGKEGEQGKREGRRDTYSGGGGRKK